MSREHTMGCNTSKFEKYKNTTGKRFLIHLYMEITFTAPSDQTAKKKSDRR